MQNLTAAQTTAVESAADFIAAGFGTYAEVATALARTLGTDFDAAVDALTAVIAAR